MKERLMMINHLLTRVRVKSRLPIIYLVIIIPFVGNHGS